jgi:quinolinate synthase
MNSLATLISALENGSHEIQVDEHIRRQAMVSVQRMLDFAAQRKSPILGYGNA